MFRYSKKIIVLTIMLFCVFSLQNNAVFAQNISSFNNQVSVDLSISPSNPKAGDTVTITTSSDTMNLDEAKITWYADGIAISAGAGQKTVTISAKNNGESTTIRAVIETVDGTVTEATTQINPAGIDLIIEPVSYVPPFYKGKPLFINQGTVRVIAVPDVTIAGKKVSSKNLTFKWQKDGIVLSSANGLGKDAVIIRGSIPIRDIKIIVDVLDSSGKTIAEAAKILSANSPRILFYENNPLYGILFNTTIGNNYYLGDREEVKMTAEPYFFDATSNDDESLNFAWSVNGNPVTSAGKINELLLRQTNTNLKGTASISLTVNSTPNIFQYTNAGFDLIFGQ